MNRLELDVAWRYLRSRRGSRLLSFITVIAVSGLVVGVSALTVIMGVMNGLQHDMREKILVGSPSIRITTMGADLRMGRWRETLDTVRAERGVSGAEPFVMVRVAIKNPAVLRPESAMIYGMPSDTTGVTSVRQYLTKGRFSFDTPGGAPMGLVLGDSLAVKLGVTVGDTVHILTIASIKQDSAGRFVGVEPFIAVVNGLFHSGLYDYDNDFAYFDIGTAQRMAQLGDAVTGIDVSTGDRWQAPAIAGRLREKLDVDVFNLEDWQTQNMPIFSALKLQEFGMEIIVLLIVLVAAFNIVSVLSLMVHDKTREIGILRAMGLKAASVRRIFVAQGVFIGVFGTALGLILGLAVSTAIGQFELIPLSPRTYFIDHLPSRTEPLDILVVAVGGTLIAFLATLRPSAQAASLYPLEAIQRE